MYCNLANYNGLKVHEENGESAQYAFDCCSENLCNNGTEWPQLPDVPVLGQFDTFAKGFKVVIQLPSKYRSSGINFFRYG